MTVAKESITHGKTATQRQSETVGDFDGLGESSRHIDLRDADSVGDTATSENYQSTEDRENSEQPGTAESIGEPGRSESTGVHRDSEDSGSAEVSEGTDMVEGSGRSV